MADGTHIEWTDATWNVINGCSLKSPGCERCYAMLLAATRLKHHPSRAGLARMHNGHAQWTGEVRFNDKVLLDPLHWRRPRKIFVCAHGDLFHEKVPDEWIDRVFAVMALCQHHVFQVLTKRPERMRDYAHALVTGNRSIWKEARDLGLNAAGVAEAMTMLDWGGYEWRGAKPLPNVWLGVSVEDQKRADERIPILLDTPAAVRWLSCEPLLGPVDLTDVAGNVPEYGTAKAHGTDVLTPHNRSLRPQIDWVVVGGESGSGARPMHPQWARSLRRQCANAGVPFLFKQWGEWQPFDSDDLLSRCSPEQGAMAMPETVVMFENPERREGMAADLWRIGKAAAGRLLDGVQHDGYPG